MVKARTVDFFCAKTSAFSVLVLSGCSSGQPTPPEDLAVQRQALTQLTHQIGRPTTTGNSRRRTTFNYDAAGREKETRHTLEGTAYEYTNQYGYPQRALGPSDAEPGTVLQSTRLPDGEIVRYEYNSGGALQKITAGGSAIVTQVRRNAKGQTISVVYGNGVESEHRYNDQGDLGLRQIVSTHRPTGRVLQAYDYEFDSAGNVKQIRDYCDPATDECPCDPTPGASCTPGRLSRAFDYDEMDRLVQVRAPAGSSVAGLPRSYAYDAIDNLTQKDGVSQSYGANGKPHALASAGGVTYNYDANGNLVSTSNGLSLVWSGQNMPVVTIKNDQRVRKEFLGEAVWKKTEAEVVTYYLPSIRVENGRLRKNYGGFAERDPDAAGALRFYHADHLGSSTLVTDAGANVVHRAAYLPYGEDDPALSRQNDFEPKYQFNFKEREETTGLYDYGARMYNPVTGRWISPDTVTTDGLNRYAYARNSPLSYTDPTGHDGVWVGSRVRGNTWQPIWIPDARTIDIYQDGTVGGISNCDDCRLLQPGFVFRHEPTGRRIQLLEGGKYRLGKQLFGNNIPGWYEPIIVGTEPGPGGSLLAGVLNGLSFGIEISDRAKLVNQVAQESHPGYHLIGNFAGGAVVGKVNSSVISRTLSSGPSTARIFARDFNMLSGHGELKYTNYSPVFQVPEGTSVTVWTRHGETISDSLGNAIETGANIDVNRIAGARTYLPGSFMPDYTLSAPEGLRILGHPITVAKDTPLSSLVRPNMGNVQWAACLYCR